MRKWEMAKRAYDEKGEQVEEVLVAGLLGVEANAAADEGVLAHEDDGVAAEALADVLELVGADIVGGGNEDLPVLFQQRAQLLVVADLLLRLRELHHHLDLAPRDAMGDGERRAPLRAAIAPFL